MRSTACSSRRAASRWPRGATPRTSRMAREHGATIVIKAPVEGITPGVGRSSVTAGGATYRCRTAGDRGGMRGRIARSLRSASRSRSRVTKEQVTYFAHAACRRVRARPLSRLDLDGRSLLLRIPHVRRGGSQGGAGCRWPRGHGRHANFEPTRRRSPGSWHFSDATFRRRSGPIIYTKTCLYTLTPDRDFVHRRGAGPPGGDDRHRRRPWVQVRVAGRADPLRARDRRPDRSRPLAVQDRPPDPPARRSSAQLHGVNAGRWRERRTGSRERGTGNREQGTGNRERGKGNRERGTGNGGAGNMVGEQGKTEWVGRGTV